MVTIRGARQRDNIGERADGGQVSSSVEDKTCTRTPLSKFANSIASSASTISAGSAVLAVATSGTAVGGAAFGAGAAFAQGIALSATAVSVTSDALAGNYRAVGATIASTAIGALFAAIPVRAAAYNVSVGGAGNSRFAEAAGQVQGRLAEIATSLAICEPE